MVGIVGRNALAADGRVQVAIADLRIFAAVVAHLQWEDDVRVGWIFAVVAAYLMVVYIVWVAKEASLEIQKVAKADYETANSVMN